MRPLLLLPDGGKDLENVEVGFIGRLLLDADEEARKGFEGRPNPGVNPSTGVNHSVRAEFSREGGQPRARA